MNTMSPSAGDWVLVNLAFCIQDEKIERLHIGPGMFMKLFSDTQNKKKKQEDQSSALYKDN